MEQNDTTTPQDTAPVEQSTVSAETPQYQSELKAFNTHVTANKVPVPGNFKTTDDWFKSLKNAQSEYTKARQELADYKKQPPQVAPPAVEAVEEVAPEQTEPVPQIQEELRIPKIEAQKEQPPAATPTGLTHEEWKKHFAEVAVSGVISPESRLAIKQRTNLTDSQLDAIAEGQKALLQSRYGEAAAVVGTKQDLAKILGWASKNLTEQQQAELNASFASPLRDVALLGLKAKYTAAMATKPTAKEPTAKLGQKVPVANSQTALTGYTTKAEFHRDRYGSAYKNDPTFRQTVDARSSRTNFNNLK